MTLEHATDFALAHTYRGTPLEQTLPIASTIISCLVDRARTQGQDPFITEVPARGEPVTLSYGELDVRSLGLSVWLRRHTSARPGDVFGLLPANDIQSVVTVFGVLRAGCAVLFLNPADPAERLREQVHALGGKAILAVRAAPPDLAEVVRVPALSELDQDPPVGPLSRVEPLADALFFGTSGSTAASKLVAQSHYNAAVNAEALRRHHRLGPGDRILGCLPIHHVNCLHFTIFATLVAGAHAILAQTFDPFGYPQLVERFRPRIASVVPSILEALLETRRRPTFPGEFGYFVSAAAPLSARTARAVKEAFGVTILQGYGLSETTNFSTTMPPDLSQDALNTLLYDADIPSIGTALYGNEVAVLAADGERAAPGDVGEICMRGHNVMMRYAGNDTATVEAFRRGWFHSQDLGFEIDLGGNGGRFVVITGRTKNIAKVRGESVSLDEMDRALRAAPHVKDAACVSVPDRLMGEQIVAVVVCSPEVPDSDLRTHLKRFFAANVLPRRIVRVDAIPKTPTGKLRRAELAQTLGLAGDGGSA